MVLGGVIIRGDADAMNALRRGAQGRTLRQGRRETRAAGRIIAAQCQKVPFEHECPSTALLPILNQH